jgi:hypothetical protein
MQWLLAHKGWVWKRGTHALIEALEARVHMSASPTTTSMHLLLYHPNSTPEWTRFEGNEITISELQTFEVDGEVFTDGTHTYRAKFSATRDGVDRTSDLLPADFEAHSAYDLTMLFNGRIADDGTWVFKYEVVQDDGARAASTFTIHVLNEAPRAEVMENQPWNIARAGEEKTLSFSLRDSFDDIEAGLTYRIDWDGDGVVDETFVHLPNAVQPFASVPVAHTYGYGGDYTVALTGEDKDGAIGEAAYFTLHVDGPPRPVDPQPEPIATPQVQRQVITPTVTANPFHTTTAVQDDSLFADTTPILA